MKIFPRQTIFFCIVVCANNFFPAASFCRQFFLYTCVQPMVSVGDHDDDYDGDNNNNNNNNNNNKFFMVFFSFLFTPRLTGYGLRPV